MSTPSQPPSVPKPTPRAGLWSSAKPDQPAQIGRVSSMIALLTRCGVSPVLTRPKPGWLTSFNRSGRGGRVAVELPQDAGSGQERFLHRNQNMLPGPHDTRRALSINYGRCLHIVVSAQEMTAIVPRALTPALLHASISILTCRVRD